MTIAIVATIQAKPDHHTDVLAALHAVTPPSRAEAACLEYGLWADPAVPGKWVMLERWQDQAGLTQHMASAHFQALTQALNGRVDSVQIDQLQPAC